MWTVRDYSGSVLGVPDAPALCEVQVPRDGAGSEAGWLGVIGCNSINEYTDRVQTTLHDTD